MAAMEQVEAAESRPEIGDVARAQTPSRRSPLVSRYRKRREALAVGAVLLAAFLIRVVKLGSIPRIVTADETDNLQTAYHIIEGTDPGFFGFDWKPAPIFSMYNQAWVIRIFGDSVAGFRMFPVILSMLTLVMFYLVARRSMSTFAACSAMALLGTNLIFLNFSRTAWENANSALFALGACYATQRALEHCEQERPQGRGWLTWWSITGLFTTLGLYGYFTGRFICIAVALIVAIAIATKQVSWRPSLRGLAIAGGITAILFLPMAINILQDWGYFNRRTSVVSIFSVPQDRPYEGDTGGWTIAYKNIIRNYQGFILQDGSEFGRGIWARYNPDGRAPLGFVTKHFLWGGMLAGLVLWRKTYTWWPFFVPLFIAEVFSLGTPDMARGVMIIPFYFLFIGLLIHELRNLVASPRSQAILVAAVVACVTMIGAWNVNGYFDWQADEGVQAVRLPGVAGCEFELWSDVAKEAAVAGPGLMDQAKFDAARRELKCSIIINSWLPALAEE